MHVFIILDYIYIIGVAKGGMQKTRKTTAIFLSLLITIFFFISPDCSAAQKTVGVIFSGDVSCYRDIHTSLMARLGREGSGEKISLIIQKPYPDALSMANSVRKLVAMEVDLIVAYGAPALLAAVSEKTKIPIVYAGVYEPIALQLKAKNITGISARVPVSSLLRYLRALIDIKTLGVFYSEHEADSVHQLKELRSLSGQYEFTVEAINIKRPREAGQAFSGKRPDALFLTGSSIVHMALPEIIDYAEGLKVPAVSLFPDKSSDAVISLSANPAEQGGKAADMVMKVLGGVSPAKLSEESSLEVELVFNLRKAKAMGWRIPMELVASATRLIR